MILVRFAVPLTAIATEAVYGYTMASEYREAQRQLDATSGKVGQAAPEADSGRNAKAAAAPGFWDFLRNTPKWGDAKSPPEPQERGRIEQMKAWLDGAVEHMLRLVAIFVVHTVLLPLAFMAVLGKLLASMLVPRRAFHEPTSP
jgi:hypothetical protein